ncbi:hypothetical protein T02_1134, partial [Trichinella nativa]
LLADQGRVSVMRDSEENAQFGVSPASVLVMPLWLEPEGKVARWLETLSELDFEGNACAVRAALPEPEDVAQSFRDQLLSAQQADL